MDALFFPGAAFFLPLHSSVVMTSFCLLFSRANSGSRVMFV